MNNFFVLTLLLTFSWNCFSLLAQDSYKPTAPTELQPGWTLTFHDEFDGPTLNDWYWFSSYRAVTYLST